MKLKPCFFCKKEIPMRIEVCPYCHRNDKGEDTREQEARAQAPSPKHYEQDLQELGSADAFVRDQAVERLAQKDPQIADALISALSDHNKPGLASIAKVLGRLRNPKAMKVLKEAMKTGDEDLRINATWALSQYHSPDTLPDLLAEIHRPNPLVQGYIAYTLGSFQDPQIVPVLSKLVSHQSPEVAFHAIDALGGMGDKHAIPTLRRALRRPEPVLRMAASSALRRLGGPVRPIFVSGWVMGVGLGLAVMVGLGWWFYR